MTNNKLVDVRGLACPRPVVETKKALELIEAGNLTVIVDSKESCQNVERFAQSEGCAVSITEKDGCYHLEIVKGHQTQQASQKSSDVVLITSDCFGTGETKLGEILMKAFLNTLWDAKTKPGKILFVNDGVKLTTEGSEVLDTLNLLEKEGVVIFSCGTCLDYYRLKDKLKVGAVTNMYDIVNSLLTSGKVIKI